MPQFPPLSQCLRRGGTPAPVDGACDIHLTQSVIAIPRMGQSEPGTPGDSPDAHGMNLKVRSRLITARKESCAREGGTRWREKLGGRMLFESLYQAVPRASPIPAPFTSDGQ